MCVKKLQRHGSTSLKSSVLSVLLPLPQFTGSSLTGGKEPLKRPDEDDMMSKQSKKRPRPMLLTHMTPLLKVRHTVDQEPCRNSSCTTMKH